MLRRAVSWLRAHPWVPVSTGLLVALALLLVLTQQVPVREAGEDPLRPSATDETAIAPTSTSGEVEFAISDEGEAEESSEAREPDVEEEELAGSEPEGSEPAPLFWEVSGDSPYLFDHPVGDYRPERHALRLAPSMAGGLGVGDRISLPIPGLGTLVATVEHVETTPLGNRGISGSIEGLDNAYAVTLTQGHSSIFGRITTPKGNYMIEGTGGAAAIFKDDLDQLIDPDSVDEVFPPESPEEQV